MKPQSSELGRLAHHGGIASPLKQRQLHCLCPLRMWSGPDRDTSEAIESVPQVPSVLRTGRRPGPPSPLLLWPVCHCFVSSPAEERASFLAVGGVTDASSHSSLLPTLLPLPHTKQQEPGCRDPSPGPLAAPPHRGTAEQGPTPQHRGRKSGLREMWVLEGHGHLLRQRAMSWEAWGMGTEAAHSENP